MMTNEAGNDEAGSDKIGMRVHGTVVAIGDWAVLMRGPSGAGKSDLALRLIEEGGSLVADDQVDLSLSGGLVYASAPATIAGLLEVRGIGVVSVPPRVRAPLALILDLVPAGQVARLPEARTEGLLGLDFPVLDFYPFEVSASGKVKVALRSLLG